MYRVFTTLPMVNQWKDSQHFPQWRHLGNQECTMDSHPHTCILLYHLPWMEATQWVWIKKFIIDQASSLS